MSKQKRGMFRRMVDAGRKAMGMPVTHHYPDPVGISPEDRAPKVGRYRQPKERKPNLTAVPPCDPGTITYHDMLVRHFGHRFANDFRRRFIASVSGSLPRPELVVPTKQEFADNPPWAWRTS